MWLGPLLLVSAVFWVCVSWQAFGRTVTLDTGGPVAARLDEMRGMDGVRIEGTCLSACTLYLGLPETCVLPSARLGFHSPSTRSGILLPPGEWDRVTRLMAEQYPAPLADWFLREARHHTELVPLSGAQAISLGARPCS